jgi:hypothetical protein
MTDLPIACSLSAADARTRAEQARTLTERHQLGREPIPGGIRLRLRPEARSEAEALVEAESRCCPFLDLRLREKASELELTVTGPEEARPIIEALLAA